MQNKSMLMIPGPTPVPESVLLAMAQHPVGHRGQDFNQIVSEVSQNLKWLHQTKEDVLILTASGTGAMEAAIINFLSFGDSILIGNNGKFGERWVNTAHAFGLKVDEITAEWGKPLNPEIFKTKLVNDKDKKIKAVIVTHSETSTGVFNDLETINKYTKAHGKALIIVDAVTSLGTTDLPIDEWGLDVVASGSQKGYMIPPGLGFVSVSQKAWKVYQNSNLPKFYLDLGAYKKAINKNSFPFTPPVNLIYGLQIALKMMKAEGLTQMFTRHEKLARATRAGIRALGLDLLAADESASHAITTVSSSKIDITSICRIMEEKFDIVLAAGQDHMKGKIFRIGHLGFVCERDILTTITCLETTLQLLGDTNIVPGKAVSEALKFLP
ncbi:MAG: alanine--glyoxylate aminotransferase family protein [Candidatus Atelocyanobacterium thalassa]